MNDFDQLLESRLRCLLDPVVAAATPIRRRQTGPTRTDGRRRLIELSVLPEILVAVPVEVGS